MLASHILRMGPGLAKSKSYSIFFLHGRQSLSSPTWLHGYDRDTSYSHQLLHSKHYKSSVSIERDVTLTFEKPKLRPFGSRWSKYSSVNVLATGPCLSLMVNTFGTTSHKAATRKRRRHDAKGEKDIVQKDTSEMDKLPQDEGDFICVYWFNHLNLIRNMSLLKVYQTVFVVGSLPLMVYKWKVGLLASTSLLSYGGVMVLSTAMLYLIAAYSMSIVCGMYMDKSKKMVKISHLTFLARRKDIFLHIENIVPLFENNSDRKSLYYNLKTYDDKHQFKLFLQNGTIYDAKLMIDLLGKIL